MFRSPSFVVAALFALPLWTDGSLATIEDVIDYYDKIRPLHLTADEKRALAAFPGALNGKVRDGF